MLPIANPGENGIEDDPRLPWYEPQGSYTDTYSVINRGHGGSRKDAWRTTHAQEGVNWDGIVMRNKNKCITDNWDESKDGCYDSVIAESMTVTQGLRTNKKMIDPIKEADMPKRGEAGYDPTRKYRGICDVPTHNLLCLIKEGGKDVVVDETTWPNESPSDMHNRTKGKRTGKGGQHVLAVDARRRYVYAYTPRHKYFEKEPTFTQQGQAEVKRLSDDMTKLIKGAPRPESDKRRQIWTQMPHLTFDNHFSGDPVIQHVGENGGRAHGLPPVIACRRTFPSSTCMPRRARS